MIQQMSLYAFHYVNPTQRVDKNEGCKWKVKSSIRVFHELSQAKMF